MPLLVQSPLSAHTPPFSPLYGQHILYRQGKIQTGESTRPSKDAEERLRGILKRGYDGITLGEFGALDNAISHIRKDFIPKE